MTGNHGQEPGYEDPGHHEPGTNSGWGESRTSSVQGIPVTSYLLGDAGRIAFEVTLDHPREHWLFGEVRIWADGLPVGDFDHVTVLAVPAGHFRAFVALQGTRHDPLLDGAPGPEVLALVHALCFDADDDRSLEEDARDWDRYSRFVVGNQGGEAFDLEFAVLLEEPERQRFIWVDNTTDSIREVSLAPGEFEGVAQQFVDWVDARTAELLAGTLPEDVDDPPNESGSD